MMAGVSASHVQAAVDAPHLSGDVGGGVGGEEMDDARNLFGRPSRPEGIWEVNLATTFSGIAATISVAIRPGVTVLTVMPIPSSVRSPDLAS
jgi:hypothetical protein